ncbi:hypothetical protein [Fibrobacter sp.]|uniref:hypothetical protein n=1 Tax=Fibrobacter sp. TaxID=35828 RepID=UPI003864702C
MKKFYQYTMILFAGVLGACSSMIVDSPYEDSFPTGFSAAEYMELHPELRLLQIRDYVSNQNMLYGDSLKAIGVDIAPIKANDETSFLANNDVLKAIYTHPLMLGKTEADWNTYVANVAAGPDDAAAQKDAKKVQTDLLKYNFVGVADDWGALQAIPVDEVAISEQYLLFGKGHGWTYRKCRLDESNLPIRDPKVFDDENKAAMAATNEAEYKQYVDTGLYCYDEANGVDRIVKANENKTKNADNQAQAQ